MVGLLVSGFVYYVLSRSIDLAYERRVIDAISESDIVSMSQTSTPSEP